MRGYLPTAIQISLCCCPLLLIEHRRQRNGWPPTWLWMVIEGKGIVAISLVHYSKVMYAPHSQGGMFLSCCEDLCLPIADRYSGAPTRTFQQWNSSLFYSGHFHPCSSYDSLFASIDTTHAIPNENCSEHWHMYVPLPPPSCHRKTIKTRPDPHQQYWRRGDDWLWDVDMQSYCFSARCFSLHVRRYQVWGGHHLWKAGRSIGRLLTVKIAVRWSR